MSAALKACAAELIAMAKENRGASIIAYGPWTFGLSLATPLQPKNIFSAKVHRSTTESDWGDLGGMAALVGYPYPEVPETVMTNPDATHYYVWPKETP